MSSLDSLVSLAITLESTTLSRAGYGTPAILDYNTRFTDTLVRSYGSLAAMTTDGFATTDLAYIAATKVFSQNPKPSTLKIFRRTNAPAETMVLTPTTAVSTTYSGTLAITGGSAQDWTYTSSATGTAATIANGLTAAIAALLSYSGNLVVSGATATGVVTLTAVTGKHFALDEISSTFSDVQDETPDVSSVANLAACEAIDSDYYGLISTSKGGPEIVALSAAIEARRKILIIGSMDKDVYNSSALTDVAGVAKTAGYDRTAIFAQKGNHMAQGDAAIMGNWLPYTPGSETMHLKTISGVAADTYTDTQAGYLNTKNALYYKTVANVNVLLWGKVASGEYLDVVRFIDWLYSNIQEDVFVLVSSNSKIPFTDAGVAQVEGIIRAVLARGISVGGLAASPAPNVIVPLVADVATADKAARNLTPITFTATLAGAIHITSITGTVSV